MVLVHSRLQLGLDAAELAGVASIECVAGMLVHNYRSHRRLLELPSRLYYNNQLMASADPKLVTAPVWNELQKPARSALNFRRLQPVPFVSLAILEFTRLCPPGSRIECALMTSYIAVNTLAVCIGVHVNIGNTVMLCPYAQLPIDLCCICLSRCAASHQPTYCGGSTPDFSSSCTRSRSVLRNTGGADGSCS